MEILQKGLEYSIPSLDSNSSRANLVADLAFKIGPDLNIHNEGSWSQQLQVKSLVNHVMMNFFDIVPEHEGKDKLLTNVLPVSIVYRHAHSSFTHRFRFLLTIEFDGVNYVVSLKVNIMSRMCVLVYVRKNFNL